MAAMQVALSRFCRRYAAQMTRAYDDEAMKPLAGRLGPPPPWWRKWLVLAVFAASVAVIPAIVWVRRRFGL